MGRGLAESLGAQVILRGQADERYPNEAAHW